MAILIILFQILLLVSCSSGNEPKTQDQQMIFRLHPELQGVKVSDEKLGLEFVVPKNWTEVSDTILQKIREMPSEIKLVCAYTDKVNGDALMVS
ncbi:hypothetical protein IT568_07075, partial [bacterium]|nr:hypothetical protein [bacterium]